MDRQAYSKIHRSCLNYNQGIYILGDEALNSFVKSGCRSSITVIWNFIYVRLKVSTKGNHEKVYCLTVLLINKLACKKEYFVRTRAENIDVNIG